VYQNPQNTSNSTVKEPTPEALKNKSQSLSTHQAVSGFSLSSIALKKAAKEKNKPKTHEQRKSNDDFEQSDLIHLWNQYTKTLKEKGKNNLASIFEMNSVKLEQPGKILFEVANDMNRVEITQEMEFLLPFLREKLNNFEIEIEVRVVENTKIETVFSPQEKYQHLLKINPNLEDLRKTFDLDF
jgi:DNA polymerase-3 subunit gamma/tau